MSALPAWAKVPEAAPLIAAILREQPSYHFTQDGWLEGGGQRRYQGPTAGKLRRLHNETKDRLFDEAHVAFEAGTPWAEAVAEFNACALATPDKLIERLLQGPIEPARHVLTNRVVRAA